MSSAEKNQYFITNVDINKKVITQEIQYYLGPESTVRPYTRAVFILILILSFCANLSTRAKTASS